MSETPLPEPLESFLQAPPLVPPKADLKEVVFQQTLALLSKPRGWRVGPLAAGIAASMLLTATVISWVLWPRDVGPVKGEMAERKDSPPPVEEKPKPAEEKPKPDEEKPKPAVVAAPRHPRDLEWTAFDAANDPERVRLYFQAGDLYLAEHDDYESALRCYTQALHYCETRDFNFNPDDNWLVMALKRDHRKEK
jgi:hypothetical protein